jgi:hypothetical protein
MMIIDRDPPRDPEIDDAEEDLQDDEQDVEEGSDAGSVDDEGRGEGTGRQEAEDDEGEEGLAAREERRPSRASSAVARAKEAAKQATERAAAFEKELQELRRERQQPALPQEESDQEFQARMSLLTVEERVEAKLDRAQKRHERELNMLRVQSADQADRAAYQAKAATNPRYAKYETEVEKLLLEERRQGRNFPRELILRAVIGDKVLSNKANVSKQRSAAQRNVERQRGTPPEGRSDRNATRSRVGQGGGLADLERRLDGRTI